ncbi:hypothetical protein KUTeg_021751 [Tegillarca granosa]|uniref:Nucleoplasmin-like domain-containing protein n=1 Tax=Tegillarca granosa TaxID=220873 RepID=A0ABQ9E4P3_TEGGR|nr:hypothetical protein KUTeg_021751 [Tegillarca granosa]
MQSFIMAGTLRETSLSTTSLTKLQKCDAPEMKKTVTVIGCSVEDMEVSFLLCDESEITVPLDIVKTAFPTEGDLESCILGHCEAGLDLQITSKGSEILKLSVVTGIENLNSDQMVFTTSALLLPIVICSKLFPVLIATTVEFADRGFIGLNCSCNSQKQKQNDLHGYAEDFRN